MKNLNKLLLVLSGFASLVLFTACGNSTTTPAASTAANTCSTGYTYVTGVGCEATAQTCPANYAWSSTYNQCLQQNTQCEGSFGYYNNVCSPLGTSSAVNTTTHTPYQGQCSSGQVQTQDGCLAQGVCQSGYGFGYWGGYPYCFAAVVSQ